MHRLPDENKPLLVPLFGDGQAAVAHIHVLHLKGAQTRQAGARIEIGQHQHVVPKTFRRGGVEGPQVSGYFFPGKGHPQFVVRGGYTDVRERRGGDHAVGGPAGEGRAQGP